MVATLRHSVAGRRAGVLLVALTIAGCNSSEPVTNEAVPAATSNAATSEAVPPAGGAPAAAKGVVLAGDGLQLADPATKLAFGTAKATVLEALATGMGGPPDQTGTDEECGPGPLQTASWSKGLVAYFQDDKFVGWGGAVDLRTAKGIGFGSTRAALDAAYHPKIEETSLGTEFSVDGLDGVLESKAPDAAIQEIWAGMTCVAR